MTDLTEPVLVDVADGVATVTLNRPDAMNSLDVRHKQALLDAVRPVAEDDAVRCVVLTGTGARSASGQDLKEHIGLLQSGDRSALFNTVEEHYNPIVQTLATMPKPVIAGVNGVAAGAGASLAFACDLRVLADTAGFNLAFAGVALSCDTGSSWTLQRLVGRAKALELLYFPRTVGRRGGPRARPGHVASCRPTRWPPPSRTSPTRLAAGPTVVPGVDPRIGRVRRGALPRRGARLRGPDDDPHRGDPGPRGRRRRLRRQGDAGLRGRYGRGSRTTVDRSEVRVDGLPSQSCQPPPRRSTTWRGASTRIRCRDGRAPYSTVSAEPRNAWLNQPVMVPWQTPPQSRVLGRQPSVAGHPTGEPGVLGVGVDARAAAGGSSAPARAAPRAGTPSSPGSPARRRAAGPTRSCRRGPPAVGEVAVQVDAVGVAAGAGGEPVGVVRRQHPHVDAVERSGRPAAPAGSARVCGFVAVHRRDSTYVGVPGSPEVPGDQRRDRARTWPITRRSRTCDARLGRRRHGEHRAEQRRAAAASGPARRRVTRPRSGRPT